MQIASRGGLHRARRPRAAPRARRRDSWASSATSHRRLRRARHARAKDERLDLMESSPVRLNKGVPPYVDRDGRGTASDHGHPRGDRGDKDGPQRAARRPQSGVRRGRLTLANGSSVRCPGHPIHHAGGSMRKISAPEKRGRPRRLAGRLRAGGRRRRPRPRRPVAETPMRDGAGPTCSWRRADYDSG